MRTCTGSGARSATDSSAATRPPSVTIAGCGAIAPAILLGDAIDAAVGSGIADFATILLTIGVVGAALGGTLEGLALRSRVADLLS